MNYLDKIDQLVERRVKKAASIKKSIDAASDVKYAGLKKTIPAGMSYSKRHRGQWFKPEYDFRQIQIAQHNDGILLRAIKKKADRILVAGHEFVGASDDPVQYVKNRIRQMEFVSGKPWAILIRETAEDMFRQQNSMWVKVRSLESSSGEKRHDLRSNKEVEPVAAYYILPFETLEFKTKVSGEIKKVKQTDKFGGETREFSPEDLVFFYGDKKPGFTVGTPDLLPALDDIALLRRIEDNVEELIETNLFPAYHYKIGSDEFPERYTPEGITESEFVKKKLEYMSAGSVFVSDHRHEIVAIGSEGKALSIENYLAYFKQRAISSAGATEVDLGMAGQANRSTANTLSKSMMLDIEAVQTLLKHFIDHEVIIELLLEGGYDPFDPENHVEIRFGIIDREERIAIENQIIQGFSNNVINLDEARKSLGEKPIDDEWIEHTFFKMFEEPLALAKSVGTPGSAGTETLANVPSSNITPEAANKEKIFAKQQEKAKAAARKQGQGRKPGTSASSGARRSSAARSRPSNQSGRRAAPKLSRDYCLNVGDASATFAVNSDTDDETLNHWVNLITDRYEMVKSFGVTLQSVTDNLMNRLGR